MKALKVLLSFSIFYHDFWSKFLKSSQHHHHSVSFHLQNGNDSSAFTEFSQLSNEKTYTEKCSKNCNVPWRYKALWLKKSEVHFILHLLLNPNISLIQPCQQNYSRLKMATNSLTFFRSKGKVYHLVRGGIWKLK